MSEKSRSGLVGHSADPAKPQPLASASVENYGDPQTVERIIHKLCREFDIQPQSAPSFVTLDNVIGLLKLKMNIRAAGGVEAYAEQQKTFQSITDTQASVYLKKLADNANKQFEAVVSAPRSPDMINAGSVIQAWFQKTINDADVDAPSAFEILKVCLELAVFLMKKNKAYGDSALKPLRIMSKADPEELIRVRMDDKLNRLIQGTADSEDPAKDFVGYWVLLQVMKRARKNTADLYGNPKISDNSEPSNGHG